LTELASRRRRRKSIGKVITDVERRVRRVEKRPGATRLKRNVVTGEKIQYRAIPTKAIQADAITANEAEFGVPVVSDTEPTDYLKAGTLWVNPDDGSAAAYDSVNSTFVPITDAAAQASADGKNTVYRQDYEPTGGTYVLGDIWFDTDDSNKLYRYSTAITATVTNKALTSNVATLTVSSAHTFVVGETITVSGVDATFNGSHEITATPTAVTVRYALTATNVTSTGSSGTIANTAGWKGFALGDGALTNISAAKITAGTLAAGVILASNIDAGQINAGTLTGFTVQTLSSGQRVRLSGANNALQFTNPSGTVVSNIIPVTRSGSTYGMNLHSGSTPDTNGSLTNAGILIQDTFVGMYISNADVSIQPGNVQISAGTYPTSSGISIFQEYVQATNFIGYALAADPTAEWRVRNIKATATAGTPTGGGAGDIVVVYT
jgi:hypothetical protein